MNVKIIRLAGNKTTSFSFINCIGLFGRDSQRSKIQFRKVCFHEARDDDNPGRFGCIVTKITWRKLIISCFFAIILNGNHFYFTKKRFSFQKSLYIGYLSGGKTKYCRSIQKIRTQNFKFHVLRQCSGSCKQQR